MQIRKNSLLYPSKMEKIQDFLTITLYIVLVIFTISNISVLAYAVEINTTKPTTCDEGKIYYEGAGLLIQKCVNGERVPYKTCDYSVIPDGKGGWMCGEPPGGCIPEGRKTDFGLGCCGNLIVENGICVKAHNPYIPSWLIIIVFVFAAFGVWKIFDLIKERKSGKMRHSSHKKITLNTLSYI